MKKLFYCMEEFIFKCSILFSLKTVCVCVCVCVCARIKYLLLCVNVKYLLLLLFNFHVHNVFKKLIDILDVILLEHITIILSILSFRKLLHELSIIKHNEI